LDRCTLSIRLKPKAKFDEIVYVPPDTLLHVAVTAPPVENRANDQCIALLAKRLRVPKSMLRIIKGTHSRNKVVACEGISEKEALGRLVPQIKPE
jgi:uncharacterized protein YggU (UPF0235/DUF167 family)